MSDKGKREITFYEKVTKSTYIGASQTVIIFALTHPLDLLKTKLQADLTKSNTNNTSLIRNIYRNDGLVGFYKAGLPNYARSLAKETYRSPLRGFFNKLYTDTLPSSFISSYPDSKNILTGLTMSFADTFISCPLERIKVWFMTNTQNRNLIYSFYSKSNSSPIEFVKDLFRGLKVSFYRSTISWVSYLVIEERIRKFVYSKSPRVSNVNQTDGLPLFEQFIVGALSGTINSAITLPFDTAKTQIQKSGNTQEMSLTRTIKYIVNAKGLMGLYSGWQFRVPSYIIVAMITSSNIQRIDKIWNSESKSD